MSNIIPVNSSAIVPYIQQINTKILPTARMIPGIGQAIQAIGAGVGIGQFMADNLPQSGFVSGRGAGRQAFSGKVDLPESRAASLPEDYKKTEAEQFRNSPDRELQPDFIRDITKAPNDPNNTGAKGTQMGGIGRMTYDQFRGDILEPLGVPQRSGLSSTNLPGQPNYGDSFLLEGSEMGDKALAGEGITDEDGGLLSGITRETVIDGDKPMEVKVSGKAKAQSRLADALEGVKAMEREDTPENLRLRARSAFLDYDGPGGALGAKRAQEDAMGVARQGGKSFLIDPEAEGGLRDISNEARKAIGSGMMSKEDALAKFPLAGAEPAADTASAKNKSLARLTQSAIPNVSQNPEVIGPDGTVEPIDAEPALQAAVPPVQVVKTEAIPKGEAALQAYFKKLDAGTLPASSYVRR